MNLIKVIGLSVGLACCMFVFLYAKDELSFDRFHTNANRIYHVTANKAVASEADIESCLTPLTV